MKAVVAAFNQEKALVGAFSVLTNLRMGLFQALVSSPVIIQKSVIILATSFFGQYYVNFQTILHFDPIIPIILRVRIKLVYKSNAKCSAMQAEQ